MGFITKNSCRSLKDGEFEVMSANPEGRYPSNVVGYFDDKIQKFFYAPKVTRKEKGDDNNHPTVKPISLMEWLIELYSPEGGLILDPFCGSGTTGIAAQNLKRQFVGIDKDKHYIEISEKRINKAAA